MHVAALPAVNGWARGKKGDLEVLSHPLIAAVHAGTHHPGKQSEKRNHRKLLAGLALCRANVGEATGVYLDRHHHAQRRHV